MGESVIATDFTSFVVFFRFWWLKVCSWLVVVISLCIVACVVFLESFGSFHTSVGGWSLSARFS